MSFKRDFDPSKTWINGEIGLAQIFVPELGSVLLQEPEGSRSQWSVLFKEIQMLDGSYVNYSIVDWNEAEDWGLLMQGGTADSVHGRTSLACRRG